MKIKIEYVILFVLILGLSVYLLYSERNETHYQLPDIPAIETDDISKLELAKQASSIVLKKRDDQWYIAPQDYPADKQKVKNMLNAIEDLSLTALVSESENFQRYDLHPDKRITVRVWTDGSPVYTFGIGKTASSFRHTFITPKGDDRIYHAMGNFRNDFDKTVSELRDKAVLAFNATDIRQLAITNAKTDTEFVRSEVPTAGEVPETQGQTSTLSSQPEIVWKTADGRTGDVDKIRRFLHTLSDLTCDGYVAEEENVDVSKPIYEIRLNGIKRHTLSIFAKQDEDDTRHPATSSANAYRFYLREDQGKNLMKAPETLMKDSSVTDQ